MTDEQHDNESHFATDHLVKDLGRRSVRGGAATVAGQWGKLVLQVGSMSVLGRLLSPADFGLVAMVSVVIGFVSLFKDLGLSTATIQREEITHAEVSSLFWLNVLFSVACMTVTLAVAPAIAAFYGEPRLVSITLVLSSTFVVSGLTAQHLALLRRQMRYRITAGIDVAAYSASVGVGLVMAWSGSGYWALVGMSVTAPVVTCALAWTKSSWRPGPPRITTGIGPLVRFGGNLSVFNTTNYFSRFADSALIGMRWGSSELGIYDRAYSLLMLPLRQINAPLAGVVVPALSRLQGAPDRYQSFYCRTVNLVQYATLPLLGLLGVLSTEVIRIVLGPQWGGADAIFTYLAIAAIGQPLLWTASWVHISLGRTDKLRNWGLVTDPLCVVSFLIGLPWGSIGVAVSYAVYVNLVVLPGMLYALAGSPVRMSALGRATWCPFALSVTMMFGAWAGRSIAPETFGDLALIACSTAGWVAVVPIFYALVPRCRTEIAAIIGLIPHLRGGRG